MAYVLRDIRGNLSAETSIDLANDYKLKITTMKVHSGNLVTTAQVMKSGPIFDSYVMYQDFRETLATNKVRVTEKAVAAQHDAATENLAGLVARADAHNAKLKKDTDEAFAA